MERQITFSEAIREALDQSLANDPSVFIMGLGVPDPKGVFGTTLGLQETHGSERVMDIPLSENAVAGIGIGAAITGMRPVIVHQRVDFSLLAMEQIANQAAKWHYIFGGRARVPMVIRMIIGRGWGQGAQHSQSLQSWFSHIPGLKVVMPTTPHDAKGLLISSIQDDNPVIFLEHRWLHNISGHVSTDCFSERIGKARIMSAGNDITIVSLSYMSLEAQRAAELLRAEGIGAQVIDLRSVRPWDQDAVVGSVQKTGRLVVVDTSWSSFGVSAEIVASVCERAHAYLKSPPVRVGLPDCPSPTSPALAQHFYPRAGHIVCAVKASLGVTCNGNELDIGEGIHLDVPDSSFAGPF